MNNKYYKILIKLTSSNGLASSPSHLSTFLNTIFVFNSSKATPPLIKLFRKSENLLSSNAAFITAIFPLCGATATTAGNPNPKFRDLSKSS